MTIWPCFLLFLLAAVVAQIAPRDLQKRRHQAEAFTEPEDMIVFLVTYDGGLQGESEPAPVAH